jgi:drug/metabolite transporter (DMT)-like permease
MATYFMDKKIVGRALLLLSVLLQSFSFLCIKYASMETGVAMLALLALACFFLVSRAVVWQKVLGLVELSSVYPYNALVQIPIFLFAVFLFGETIRPHHVAGFLIMLGGLFLLSRKA